VALTEHQHVATADDVPDAQQPSYFAENFDRLLGLHRLSAKEASEFLDSSAASLSYWRNGHREPDRDSLWKISMFFAIDP
jgi:transcriptional regulator with XRE-family HTH domain